MRIGRLVVVLAFAAVSFPASLVQADPVPSLDLRGFSPPTNPRGNLYLEPTVTPGHLNWNVGVWASYAHRSIVLRDPSADELAVPVEHQFSVDYLLGLGLGERLELGVSLPTVVYQDGDDVETLVGAEPLPHTALGDVGIGLKATLLAPGELGGFGLAALSRVTLPSGNASSYISESAATGQLRLLGELKLVALNVRASVGAKVRGAEQRYVDNDFGHELPWGFGIGLRPQVFGWDREGRWEWTFETRGAVAITPSFASQKQSPVLGGVSARYSVGDVSAIFGVEFPFSDAVGVPVVRGIIGFGWAPRFYDSDQDSIADEVDECPELAEDKDSFEDSDGCPDFDNDDDGVPDDTDRCPAEQEDVDDLEDEDGCKDPDNDHDGIKDELDACPNEAGAASPDAKRNGCPARDQDLDGIFDPNDKCPTEAEDRDAFQDDDGCPDPDNDGDGIVDQEDACPDVRGEERSDPHLSGCPSPDRDGDTFDDDEDKCPEQPETFDGVQDDDGCGEATPGKRALAVLEETRTGFQLRINGPLAFEKTEVSHASLPTLRAISQLLNAHPEFVLLVGVRAAGKTAESEQEALSKSFAIVHAIRRFTHRDQAAESVGFKAVQTAPGAARGIGLSVLAEPPKPTPTPAKAPPQSPAKPITPVLPKPTTPPQVP